jgi:hypothetical protein
MHRFQQLWIVGLVIALVGCETGPSICTASFAMITATIVDGNGQTVTGVSVRDTVGRTGRILDVQQENPGTFDPGIAIIFTDAFITAIRRGGDDVTTVVTADGLIGSAEYRFGSDGCHVRKLGGPDTIVVS